jgi:hypothetical protein
MQKLSLLLNSAVPVRVAGGRRRIDRLADIGRQRDYAPNVSRSERSGRIGGGGPAAMHSSLRAEVWDPMFRGITRRALSVNVR